MRIGVIITITTNVKVAAASPFSDHYTKIGTARELAFIYRANRDFLSLVYRAYQPFL